MAKPRSPISPETPGASTPVPPEALWQAPMAWTGSPPQPVTDTLMEFSEAACFVRGELAFTLSVPIGEGMTRQTFPRVPGLIRLDASKVVEVHFGGFEEACWTYRLMREGRKQRWALYKGATFPADVAVPEPRLDGAEVSQVVVQSLIPLYGTGKRIAFIIHDDGRMEVLVRFTNPEPERDPDPDDD